MSKLRMGILGAARIAPTALCEPASDAGVEVVAIAARDTVRAEVFAKENSIPSVEPSYDALISRDDLDAIYVPLPAALRHDWVIRGARNGLHVLAEKPIGLSAEQANDMFDAADEHNIVLLEGFHYLFHPMMQRVLALLDTGALGPLQHLEAIFEGPPDGEQSVVYTDPALGGGALLHQGCYVLSLLRALAKAEPTVNRAGAIISPSGVDESVDAELVFPGDVQGRIVCSMSSDRPLVMRALVRGSLAHMELDNWIGPHFGRFDPSFAGRLKVTANDDTIEVDETFTGESTYVWQLRAFRTAVQERVPLAYSRTFSTGNMEALDAVARAAGLRPR
jgi:predicted dehydrogenase